MDNKDFRQFVAHCFGREVTQTAIWNIGYDLRNKYFLHLESLEDPPQHIVRVNKLADGAAFYKYYATLDALSAPDKDSLKKNADQLFNRFKDYKVATVTLGDMSIQMWHQYLNGSTVRVLA